MTYDVEFREVCRWYKTGKPVLADVSFCVPSQATVGILGPNGSGKSTAIKLLAGISRPNVGEVSVFGKSPFYSPDSVKRNISICHQNLVFEMMLTVTDNLKIISRLHGLRWRNVREFVFELAAEFSLSPSLFDEATWTLSGGQMNRVNLIKTLMVPARLYVLDEPTSGVDVEGRIKIWSKVREICVQRSATTLWTSHSVEEIDANCSHILLFSGDSQSQLVTIGKALSRYGFPRLLISLDRQPTVDDVTVLSHMLGTNLMMSGRHMVSVDPWTGGDLDEEQVRSGDPRLSTAVIKMQEPNLESVYFGFQRFLKESR